MVGYLTYSDLLVLFFPTRASTLMEFDCFVETHRYMYQYVPWSDIEHPLELSDEEKDSLAQEINNFIERVRNKGCKG